jgi:hypothetical protein
MRSYVKIAAAGLALIALAACNSKPKTTAGQPAASAAPAVVTAASDCPSAAPDKSAVGRAIKAAMLQIYGADESGMQFTVTALAQTEDCKHYTVTYHAGGSAPSAVPLIYGDDSRWYLTLYKKPYAVE